MKLTFDQWILNTMTGANPTQYTKFDKYKLKTHKSTVVRNGVLGRALIALSIDCLLTLWGHPKHVLEARGHDGWKDSLPPCTLRHQSGR